MHKIPLTYLVLTACLLLAFTLPTDPFTKTETSYASIQWDEEDPLLWSDFRGKAKNWGGISALTASAIEYSYDCYRNQLDLSVKAIFIPEESWVRDEARTDYILAHEQLHFDITEVYARKLRKDLSEGVKTCNDVWKIERIARKVIDEWKRVQHRYDQDTHHSLDKELQVLWEEKVAYDLAASEDYAMREWILNY